MALSPMQKRRRREWLLRATVAWENGMNGVTDVDLYAVNDNSPDVVADFASATEYFRVGGSDTTFASMFDLGTTTAYPTSLRTMVDSDGLLKWGPHNLALNSAAPATQNITVTSGADYTVEITGSGSVTLSNAGTGTVTAGSPVEITAGSTTLTLTVSGSPTTMWCYRSDLGGMVNNPDTGTPYVPTTGTVRYLHRRGNHTYNGSSWVKKGILLETEARTNLLLNSGTLATQNVTTSATPYTLSFTGTGTVTLSGTSTAGPLVGTGTGENNRVNLTFTPTAGTLTLTVSGTVTNAQLEAGSTVSSHIPTAGATVTRTADALTIPAANMSYSATAMSFQMDGTMTYADRGTFWSNAGDGGEVIFINWRINGNEYINMALQTASTDTGKLFFAQETSAVFDNVQSSPTAFAPGTNVSFNLAMRNGATFVNGAVGGTALTANTTPTALPNLSAINFSLGNIFNGNIGQFRQWDVDLTDAGIEAASS